MDAASKVAMHTNTQTLSTPTVPCDLHDVFSQAGGQDGP
jgi:hypothetical protein